jgi:3-phenylpropionate/trans-cinnamate dioxygenase ferredoxin reductase subunit
MLLESWYNAMEQAAAIARTITAEETPYAPVPRFWTDQLGRNFQMVGDFGAATRFVMEGERGPGKFAALYLDDRDRLVFALVADDPRRARLALKSIQTGAAYDGAVPAQTLAVPQPA